MSVLGYDTGARGGGEVLGKLLAARQTPFIGLYHSQLRTQHHHQHHTQGEWRTWSIREADHTASSKLLQTIKQTASHIGWPVSGSLPASASHRRSGEGEHTLHSHTSEKSLELYFSKIVVTREKDYLA